MLSRDEAVLIHFQTKHIPFANVIIILLVE